MNAFLTQLLQQLIIGVSTGAIYALIALGYTMVYGIIELINFAHGDIFMIGTFISITIFNWFGITSTSQPTGFRLVGILLVTLLGAMVFCAVLGVLIERVAYRRLRNAPRLAPLISAIGVSLILEDVGKLWKGFTIVSFPQIFPQVDYFIGPVYISSVNILVIVVAVGLMIALQLMVTRTRTGRAMRSVAQDREAAALMGVNVDRIIAITFFIGAGLAGAAGLIYGLQYGSTNFVLGFQLGLFAFTAAVLGGIGTLLIKWIVALLVPVAVFTFVWSGEAIINNVILGLITPGSTPYDTPTLIAAAIFILVFYVTVVALAGYLVAADSGRRGMINLWIDILVFALVPLVLVITFGLIIGLALCAIVWSVYFYIRNLVRKARHSVPLIPQANLEVLTTEQQSELMRRAIAGSFWFGVV